MRKIALILVIGLATGGSFADDSDTDAPAPTDQSTEAARTIDLHVGIPGLIYIGQPLEELEEKFEESIRVPFAGQDNVQVVQIAPAGISCYAVGESPDDLKIASIGFNFDRPYEGIAESGFRTAEGIGKGSSVNDVLGTYGRAEIADDGPGKSALRRRPQREDPGTPKKYLYTSEDGKVRTYFVIQGSRVLRIVINEIAPLERYIMKSNAKSSS